MISYRIEIYDGAGRRIQTFDDSPLFEATRSGPDEADVIRGILPGPVPELSPGCRVRVVVGNAWFCDAEITRVGPQWSDTRKLILDRYVMFHEVIEFEAARPKDAANTFVSRGFVNRPVSAMVKSVINSAPGPIHYTVPHTAYPEGAQREYQKFLARMSPDNALETGGITRGQWVGANRIDCSGAYAKDGDTISGVVVDSVAWPDVRMLMIDSEETGLNPHALKRHPEVANWTSERYAASGYKFAADKAKQALQALIDAHGIDYLELNPHQDADGAFDDRVDVYGRYIGMVYGGGLCFNAAQVEQGHADVYLWEDGQYHVPEMELKDFFSYTGPHDASIQDTQQTLAATDIEAGALEVLTALAYAAGGYVWTLEPDWTVRFYTRDDPDRVVFFNPVETGVTLGSDSSALLNAVYFGGNPIAGPVTKTYRRYSSIDAFGVRAGQIDYFPISTEADADKLVNGLLDDLAYPELCGSVQFYHGNESVRVGDLIEVRGAPVRRLERIIEGEWGGRYAGRIIGRVKQVTHRFSGREVSTTVMLTSPLRSVARPVTFLLKNQEPADALYQFRLDDSAVGADMGFHLD